MRRQTQRDPYVRLPLVGLNGSQQGTELAWFDDCGAVLDLGGDERTVQI